MALTDDQRAALKAEIQATPALAGKSAAEVWDALCSEKITPGQAIDVAAPISRFAALEAVPALFDLEAGLRERARGDAKAETALACWTAGQPIDFASGLGARVLEALQPGDADRAALLAMCKRATQEAATVEPPRRMALFGGAAVGSLDDVKAVLAEIAGG